MPVQSLLAERRPPEAGARLVVRNLRLLARHARVTASGQDYLLDILDRLELQDRHPSEAELSRISAIRAAACFSGEPSCQ